MLSNRQGVVLLDKEWPAAVPTVRVDERTRLRNGGLPGTARLTATNTTMWLCR